MNIVCDKCVFSSFVQYFSEQSDDIIDVKCDGINQLLADNIECPIFFNIIEKLIKLLDK